jgi:hypothetical protein
MLVMAALITLGGQLSGVPVPGSQIGFDGIWRNEGGVYCVTAPNEVSSLVADRHGMFAQFKQTPDGAMLGTWAETTRLKVTISSVTSRGNVVRWIARSARLQPAASGGAVNTSSGDSPSERGWVKLYKGPLTGAGLPGYIKLARYTSRNAALDTFSIYRLGPIDRIQFGATYSTKYASVSWTEVPVADGFSMSGSATYMGTKYKLEGTRVYSRGTYRIIDMFTGREVGGGSIEWAPSEKQVSEFVEGKWGPSDRIAIDYTFPSKAPTHEFMALQ